MGVLVEVTFDKETGKVKYFQETEGQKENVKKLKQFVEAHKGDTAFKYFMDKEEVNFNKKLPNFYRMIMLQPLFEKMKTEYGLTSINDLDATLSVFYLKKELIKFDGTKYEVPVRIENISFAEQIEFVAKVANLAITKYAIKYPNANEVDNMNLKTA